MKKNLLCLFGLFTLLSCNENAKKDCNFPYFTPENTLDLSLNDEAQNSLEEIMKFSNYEFTDKISKINTEIFYELTQDAQYFYFQDTRILGPDNRTYYTWILPIRNLNPDEIYFQGQGESENLLLGNGDDDKGRFSLRITSLKDVEIFTTCETHSYMVITFKKKDMVLFKKNMISFLQNFSF